MSYDPDGAITVLQDGLKPGRPHTFAQADGLVSIKRLLVYHATLSCPVIQLIFGFVQWKNPKKFIAILFIVLIVLGLLSSLAAPLMAGMPGAVAVPLWQTVLSVVILIVQLVLHFAGLRGMNKLDALQMNAAR